MSATHLALIHTAGALLLVAATCAQVRRALKMRRKQPPAHL
jgi:hypothetical protein